MRTTSKLMLPTPFLRKSTPKSTELMPCLTAWHNRLGIEGIQGKEISQPEIAFNVRNGRGNKPVFFLICLRSMDLISPSWKVIPTLREKGVERNFVINIAKNLVWEIRRLRMLSIFFFWRKISRNESTKSKISSFLVDCTYDTDA